MVQCSMAVRQCTDMVHAHRLDIRGIGAVCQCGKGAVREGARSLVFEIRRGLAGDARARAEGRGGRDTSLSHNTGAPSPITPQLSRVLK